MEIARLVYGQLVADTVDTSSSNPCLLTLANRAPQRIQAQGLNSSYPASVIPQTTVGTGGAVAGQSTFPVTSLAGILPGQVLWLGGANPETVVVGPTTPTPPTGPVPVTNPLQFSHTAGSLVSGLPTIITQSEPRGVIDDPSAYWRLVIGPTHIVPVAMGGGLRPRAPTRLYEAVMVVKLYDSQPSRKLAEDVLYRLDWLLNLGEAGANGNADPLLGVSPSIYVQKAAFLQAPEPHFDYATQVQQVPLFMQFTFEQTYS